MDPNQYNTNQERPQGHKRRREVKSYNPEKPWEQMMSTFSASENRPSRRRRQHDPDDQLLRVHATSSSNTPSSASTPIPASPQSINPIAATYVGTFVQTPTLGDLEIFLHYILVVNSDGYIEDFQPLSSPAGQSYLSMSDVPSTVLAPGSFFLPTFCDLHLHAPQFLYMGTGLHLPLMEWLDSYAFKAEERLDEDPHGLAARVYKQLTRRLIEHGTGAALVFGTINEETNITLATAFQDAGIRGFIGKLSMDKSSRPTYVEESATVSLASANSFIQRCRHLVTNLPKHQRLVEPVLTPRFVPTCSDELLSGLGKISMDSGVKIQSHLAEARDQVDWVESERGKSDIQVFQDNGLLTPRTIQAHCTFLDRPSLKILRESGTAVAHCPLSNVYFSSLPFPLREALDLGVHVGLGSDVAGGYTLDIMNAMRQAVIVARTKESARREDKAAPGVGIPQGNLSVDWKESLYLATRGGSVALGLDSGHFEKGAPFDVQQINLLDPYTGIGLGQLDFFDPLESLTIEALEKWWCIGNSFNRSAVWIQGRKIF